MYGVDLYPPPTAWVPPNCFLEVEDVLQDWTWRQDFDLIHLRLMLGAFTEEQWTDVYQKCYEYVHTRAFRDTNQRALTHSPAT